MGRWPLGLAACFYTAGSPIFDSCHDAPHASKPHHPARTGPGRPGLGARLTDECIAFARAKGYKKMVLWTNSCLTTARHIYARRGFVLVKSEPYEGFGQHLVGETWELKL